ncbi:hypothetical protein QVD17_41427 [Tagetes erecta]|uniref:Uncharacterized protein n=1 Tax=Tagetes erecta TaxID=13708 RepID=A0AAD8N8U3_TARER|nr:hypothetical protein QVD17_41427 [Tagetes erecta]
MSIGNVPDIDLFDYMRDIVNNEEEVDGVYYHISHGEIVNPLDLVDEVPDNLLDDDEYFARHPEDEEDEGDDGNNDGDDGNSNDDGGNDAESESNSEEAEPTETELEVVEPMVVEEPVEVASVVVEKDVSVQYVRKKKKVVEKPEEVDVIEIAQIVMAEAESIAQIEEVDAGFTDPIIDENIGQGLESSPNVGPSVDEIYEEKEKRIAELEEMVEKLIKANELMKASNDRKKKRFDEYWDIHNQNLKIFKELDSDHLELKIEHDKLKNEHDKLKAEHEKLKEDYDNLKYDYTEVKAECNTLEAEKEMLEKELEDMKPKKASSSLSDKDFSDDIVEVTETNVPKVYLTRARGTTNVGILVESPITIPDEAEAETVKMDKAEGKRKIDAIPEIFGDEESFKRAKVDEPVQIEPIQSVAVIETEKATGDEITKSGQIEPIQSGSVTKTEEFVATKSEKEAGSEDTVQFEPIQAEAVEVESGPEIVSEVASQFEPIQTDEAPMIEALDDLDIDWTDSENEAELEPVQTTVEEMPDDLDQRFAYLERMKFESGLT